MTAKQTFHLVFAGCVSCLVFVGCMSQSQSPALTHHDLLAESVHAAVDLRVLQHLETGDTNGAVRILEKDLNLEKLYVEQLLVEMPEHTRDTNISNLVYKILVYQTNHPAFGPTNAGNR
jgi:hypothetical protein